MAASITHSTPADGTFSASGAVAWDAEHIVDIAHNALSDLQLAASGVTYGHIDDQAQTIAGVKTFTNGIIGPAVVREITSGDITIATTDNGYVVTYTGSSGVNIVLPAVSGFTSNFQAQIINMASAAVDLTITSEVGEYKGAGTKISQYKSAYGIVRNSKWWFSGGLS